MAKNPNHSEGKKEEWFVFLFLAVFRYKLRIRCVRGRGCRNWWRRFSAADTVC